MEMRERALGEEAGEVEFQENLVVWKFELKDDVMIAIALFQENLVVWKWMCTTLVIEGLIGFQENLVVWKLPVQSCLFHIM